MELNCERIEFCLAARFLPDGILGRKTLDSAWDIMIPKGDLLFEN